MAFTQDNRYFKITTPLGKDKLLLTSFSGVEGISTLFHFDLELESEDPALDFKTIVGKGATVAITLADDSTRYLHGIVTRFVAQGGGPVLYRYRAELSPWLWLMTQSVDCRIFQEKSVPDIITQVFGDLGFTDFKKSLTGSYTPREYCVQYNETAFAFVSRLMEDEGIFYFFEHADGKHTLVMGDDASAFVACTGAAKVSYGHADEWTQQNSVKSLTVEENVIPGAFALDDFSFETPSTDLMASVDSTLAQNGSKRRIYAYPGGFLKKDQGDARTKKVAVEHEVRLRRARGESFCRAFVAGTKTTLENHGRADFNVEYVLARLEHRGSLNGYSNSFEAFPSSAPFRPPRATPRPVIPGTQTAIVVGKSGEEIWTDKYGRIKVQFHWDQLGKKDEKSSCWIRVAHGWAGKSWGQIFLPRIGQEVVVSFLEGDPDRPLVTGSVYNAEQTVPYGLPDDQTKSTIKSNVSKGGGGYNELRFEDKKDSEEVYVQAEKDYNRVVKNNDTLKVGFEKKDKGDQTIDVYNDRTVTIDQGNESLQVKKGNRSIKVDTGNETHDVKGTRTLTITGDETHNDKANFNHNVDGNYVLKVKGDLTIDVTGKVTIKSGAAMAIESGATLSAKAATSFTAEAGTSYTAKAGTSLTNEAGTSLTNKAGTSLTNDAGISMTNKASATQTVDGGGMLTLKGGLVKIN
ncbi:MAG TPA: type VI secretion system tip protein TssI/VgrG [Thermoanaerobaculia bacterium]|nr:type VI secretion system tip protein TssI/VgrG [Thermoanaerobaculia bacterium]